MNRKGFTFIELLATIVILGILTSLTVSTLLRTIERSRNKVYINDASTMVAQAEYLAKSKPNKIKRPTHNNCVVILLNVFNSDDFSSPPNGGKYSVTKSFVVYKSNYDASTKKETFEFSGVLFEELKDNKGFSGVKLTSGVDLSKGKGEIVGGISNVVVDSSKAKMLQYINGVIPNYCGAIDAVIEK